MTIDRRTIFNLEPRPPVRNFRPGTKRAHLIEMLNRPAGATVEEVMEEIGWDQNNAVLQIKLVNEYVGYGLRESKKGRIRIYRPKG